MATIHEVEKLKGGYKDFITSVPDVAAKLLREPHGETDEDFQATAELIEQLPFSYLHVFSFSTRPGTAAAQYSAQVPLSTTRERARALRALGLRKATAFRSSQAGRVLRALTLARGGEIWTEALTGNYLKVRIPGRFPANQWHMVSIDDGAAPPEGPVQASKIT